MPNHLDDPEKIVKRLENTHYLAGPIYQRNKRWKAAHLLKTNELEAIYHLVESHVPGLRQRIVLRYEKIFTSSVENAQQGPLMKEHVAFTCSGTDVCNNIDDMMTKVQNMPQEWTIVQVTPAFNTMENVEIDPSKCYTNPLFMSVFNCGANQPKPFCVKVPAPKCSVTGNKVELMQEMFNIIKENKGALVFNKDVKHFRTESEKQKYYTGRQMVDARLKALIKDLQELYLREWRCLLVGKYINNDLEIQIQNKIKDFFKTECPNVNLTDKMLSIVQCLVKGVSYLKLAEIKRSCRLVLAGTSDKKIETKLVQFLRNLHDEMGLFMEKKHPLILIPDDTLDFLPWEMMDILTNVPVTRLPSLHVAYALYNEHKTTVKNGLTIVKKPQNGNFIVNPGMDLKNMQNRIISFFEYWLPTWKGIAGSKPTEDEFEKMLLSGDVFSYSGHGAGTNYFSLQKIEKIRVNAAVFMFGCGSSRLTKEGPQVEMYGTYQMYLIACSPSIVGMLWEVTDLDTDILTTEILSQWIPNQEKSHWKYLDKSKWKKGNKVDFPYDSNPKIKPHEPNLLHVLSLARKCNLFNFYITKAGCVARGLPVQVAP